MDNLNKNQQVFGTAVKHHKVDALWMFEPWAKSPTKTGFTMSQGKNRGGGEEAEGNWYYGSDGLWTHSLGGF